METSIPMAPAEKQLEDFAQMYRDLKPYEQYTVSDTDILENGWNPQARLDRSNAPHDSSSSGALSPRSAAGEFNSTTGCGQSSLPGHAQPSVPAGAHYNNAQQPSSLSYNVSRPSSQASIQPSDQTLDYNAHQSVSRVSIHPSAPVPYYNDPRLFSRRAEAQLSAPVFNLNVPHAFSPDPYQNVVGSLRGVASAIKRTVSQAGLSPPHQRLLPDSGPSIVTGETMSTISFSNSTITAVGRGRDRVVSRLGYMPLDAALYPVDGDGPHPFSPVPALPMDPALHGDPLHPFSPDPSLPLDPAIYEAGPHLFSPVPVPGLPMDPALQGNAAQPFSLGHTLTAAPEAYLNAAQPILPSQAQPAAAVSYYNVSQTFSPVSGPIFPPAAYLNYFPPPYAAHAQQLPLATNPQAGSSASALGAAALPPTTARGRYSSADATRFRNMVNNGDDDDHIATALGRTPNAIYLKRKRESGSFGDAHASDKRRRAGGQ